MSPPDGNVVATEQTHVHPGARRLAVAASVRALAEKERGVYLQHGRRYIERASTLRAVAESLEETRDNVPDCLVIALAVRNDHERRAELYPGDVGALNAAMLPILDEALDLLRGLR